MKPCEQPCPKCGHEDVARTFHLGGSHIKGTIGLDYGECPIKDHKWLVSGGGHYWKANSDMIQHVCRCCEFSWATKPMKKPKKQRSDKAGENRG